MSAKAASQALFESGKVVGGKYRIISLLGMGGVGRVYLARHIELDTEVAIKVLKPEMLDRPEIVQRFGREARASVRLRSERIARILDVGTHEGAPYFVMEHMVGCNLLEYRQQVNVDIATLCELFIQACEGLAEAHAHGVVHRDIKSENLFVVRDASGWRSLKVFDFGISKFSLTGKFSDVDLAAMRTEVMMGTPHYISPEQIRSSRDVDHRTDLWSLGAVMFEVLSGGILPFREEREVTALVAEVLERPHRSLLDVAPNVPERLAAIVDRCLVKDRNLRYQTAAEIALDLLPLAPVRARASAERAVSATQAAGMMAVNGDMESLRPMPVQPVPRGSSPAPRPSASPLVDTVQGPPSGLRPSESKLLAAAPVRPSPGPSSVRPQPSRPPPEPLLTPGPSVVAVQPPLEVIEEVFVDESFDEAGVTKGFSDDGLLEGGLVDQEQVQRKKRKRWLLLLIALLGVVVLLVLFLTTNHEPPERVPAAIAPVATAVPTVAAPDVSTQATPEESAAHAPSASPKAVHPNVLWAPRPAAPPKLPPTKSSTDSSTPSQLNRLELRRER